MQMEGWAPMCSILERDPDKNLREQPPMLGPPLLL